MEIAALDFKTALQTLRRLGLLLETDARLPSVASLIAGEPISGSWWSHAFAQNIFATLVQFEDHRDVMFTKLISGKVTWCTEHSGRKFLLSAKRERPGR